MRLIVCIISLGLMVNSCGSKPEEKGQTFTLETGVTLIKLIDSDRSAIDMPPSIEKVGDGYLVTLLGRFNSDGALDRPFLTITIDKKATLVINSKQQKGAFGSSRESRRVLTIKLSDRLERGDTLYLLTDGDVVGHLFVP